MVRSLSKGFLAVALACGAANTTTAIEVAQPLPDAAIAEAAAPVEDAWQGEGCRTITSPSTVDIAKVAVTGSLYNGNNHCYLDLKRPLCFEYASDSGAEKVEVASLRIAGNACGSGEAELRGKLSGPIVPVRRHGSAIEVDASAVKRITRAVTIAEIADKPASLDELRARFASCAESATTSGSLVLGFQISPDGAVADVRRQSGTGLTSEIEQCVTDAARAAKFNAGAARHVTLPVTFARSLDPLE